MFALHKNYFYISILLLSSLPLFSEEDPYIFIDTNAQKMVQVLIENKDLFSKDRDAYEDKIKEIFDPMIDFRRVAASVMGKKYYQASSPLQRKHFVAIFRNSLLNTYSETLAQWGDQSINTIPGEEDWSELKSIEVKQMLDTGSTKYPISYKLRRSNNQWMIVNIIVNGVNLGLTFRNQFQALANNHNGDIEMILKNWVSDAGDAGIESEIDYSQEIRIDKERQCREYGFKDNTDGMGMCLIELDKLDKLDAIKNQISYTNLAQSNLIAQQQEEEKKQKRIQALINLGAYLSKTPSVTQGSAIAVPKRNPSLASDSYTYTSTVPSNQNCPSMNVPLKKQEVKRGNRICYY